MTDTTRPQATSRELPLEPGGEVEIVLTSNELRLRGTDDERVVVRTRGGQDIDPDVTIEATPGHVRIRDGGAGEFRLGPLRIGVRHPADLDIDIPRSARVSVRTLSGDVDGSGIGGASRWSTASGDLRLQIEGGPVAVDSMSGDATIESTAAFTLTARLVSGDLRVTAPRLDALTAETTSGDVRIDAALGAGAVHAISSVSGDVQLETASPVRLEVQTVAGDVRASGTHRAEGGRGRRTLVTGDGSVPVSVRTMSGDVHLRAGTPPASAEVPWSGTPGVIDRREAARLEVLRALERGDVDIEAASRRLEALEEAGPRSFRGWC